MNLLYNLQSGQVFFKWKACDQHEAREWPLNSQAISLGTWLAFTEQIFTSHWLCVKHHAGLWGMQKE